MHKKPGNSAHGRDRQQLVRRRLGDRTFDASLARSLGRSDTLDPRPEVGWTEAESTYTRLGRSGVCALATAAPLVPKTPGTGSPPGRARWPKNLPKDAILRHFAPFLCNLYVKVYFQARRSYCHPSHAGFEQGPNSGVGTREGDNSPPRFSTQMQMQGGCHHPDAVHGPAPPTYPP
jgi:hypothetical protein